MVQKLEVKSLDFYCDWGCADQFSEIIVSKLSDKVYSDIFISSGNFVYARNLVNEFIKWLGCDYQNVVVEKAGFSDNAVLRTCEFDQKWILKKKQQRTLLAPLDVLKKIYFEYSKTK